MRVGIDLIDIERLELSERFLKKIAGEAEIAYILAQPSEAKRKESLGGLWAVKEAVFKLLGLGRDSTVVFKNIELCHENSGRPYVKLNGIALETFKLLGLSEIEVSISHTALQATAIAVARG